MYETTQAWLRYLWFVERALDAFLQNQELAIISATCVRVK